MIFFTECPPSRTCPLILYLIILIIHRRVPKYSIFISAAAHPRRRIILSFGNYADFDFPAELSGAKMSQL